MSDYFTEMLTGHERAKLIEEHGSEEAARRWLDAQPESEDEMLERVIAMDIEELEREADLAHAVEDDTDEAHIWEWMVEEELQDRIRDFSFLEEREFTVTLCFIGEGVSPLDAVEDFQRKARRGENFWNYTVEDEATGDRWLVDMERRAIEEN